MNSKAILLIEDSDSDVGLTRRALHKANIFNKLVVASDGQEALDYLSGTGAFAGRDISDLPAITFLDLKLPKVLGLEVLRRIRGESRTRRMPVVILYLIQAGVRHQCRLRPRREQLYSQTSRFQSICGNDRADWSLLAGNQRPAPKSLLTTPERTVARAARPRRGYRRGVRASCPHHGGWDARAARV